MPQSYAADDVELEHSYSADDVEVAPGPADAGIQRALSTVPVPRPDFMQTESLLPKFIAGTPAPTAVSPEAKQYEADLARTSNASPTLRGVAGTAAEALTSPTGGGVSTNSGEGANVTGGVQELQTPGMRMRGAGRLALSALNAATPLIGPAVLEADTLPKALGQAFGFGEGYVGGKAAKKVTKAAGGGQEAQNIAEGIGQLSPIVAHAILRPQVGVASSPEGTTAAATTRGAGAGVAVTPEAVTVRGKLGPLEGSKTFARTPKAVEPPALTPQTIEGELAANPATRDEISHAQAATKYAGPEQAKAAVVAKRQALAAAATETAASEKPAVSPATNPPQPATPNVTERPRMSANVTTAKKAEAVSGLPAGQKTSVEPAPVKQTPATTEVSGNESGQDSAVNFRPDEVEISPKTPAENSSTVENSTEKPPEFTANDVEDEQAAPATTGKIELVQQPKATPEELNKRAIEAGIFKSGPGPEPGEVGTAKISDLKMAPNKFQYKLGTDAEGVTALLRDQNKYNHDLAGVVSVWRDPSDGKMYVVNGHHRFELAKRTGQDSIAVRHVKASTQAQARSIGALQNIAEGRGTPIDAAKFFRDANLTPEDLKKEGISLGESTARQGLALSRLDTPIFNKVVSGDLRIGRAATIGEATNDPAEQKAILNLVERKEARGQKISDGVLSELVRFVKESGRKTETTADLFGSQEVSKSLALEKAEVSDYIKQQLSKDKKLFGFVAKEGRAEELARAGNKIDVDKSKEISTGAAQSEEVYNRLSARGGELADILNQSARRLSLRENPATVKADAYKQVRDSIQRTLGGGQESSALRSEGSPEGGGEPQEAQPALSQPETPVEPTLPGMESVPAERAEANAEQQGKQLTEKLTEPPRSVERAAGEIEQKSPLFRDTAANPQRGIFDVLNSESGTFEPEKFAEATKELFKQDVAPSLSKAGVGLKETAAFFIKALYPRIEESSFLGRTVGVAAPTEAVDSLMKLKGERARAMAEFDGIMHGLEKMFDRIPDAERVNFIDRLQTGQKQPTPELQEIAEAIAKIQASQRLQEQDAANLGRPASQRITLPTKENYFHNRWETPPGSSKAEDEDTRISRLFTPRRPLEGSKSYNKQQSYTLKSGIAAGGKPVTTNPVRLLRLRIEDGMKFVTARRAWNELGKLGLREFVAKGERMPEGFDPVDDRIARVYFPAETVNGKTVPVEGGQWAVEANTARLLNNMLSRDLIRANPVGRGLMWLKNASTALELGLSPFHAVFETIEAASSQLALGALRSYNLGIRGADAGEFMTGLRQILETPVAPITMAREGAALPAYVEARARLEKIGVTEFGQKQIEGKQPHGVLEAISHFREVRKQSGIQRLLKRYPDLDQLLDDMFTGGLVIGQHQDYQVKMLGKSAAEAWSAGNPIGAMVRAIPTSAQVIMKPLFQWYIPNLKYSLFLRQMSEQAAEHAADLESGAISRAELARRVADSVENRFGELNFDNLFWNRTFKTAMQFAFRSVTWKLGNIRELGGAAAGQAKALGEWAWQANRMLNRDQPAEGKIDFPEPQPEKPGALPKLDQKASWLMSLMITTAALGIVLSKALTKKYPWEWADEQHKDDGTAERAKAIYLETVHPRTGELDSRGKPVRVSLPTYWKDVEHASSNPAQYVMGSLSSTLGKGIDLAHNEDYFGNYVYNPNAALGTQLKQAGKYAFPEPFSVGNFERGKQSGGAKTAWLSAFGFPKAPSDLDFTPAEKLAQNLLKVREPRHTPEELEQWEQKHEAFEQGKLSGAEMHRYLKNQRGTWLQREVKKLTYGEAMRVLNKASDEERSSLRHVIAEKRANLLKRGGYKKVEDAEEVER